MRSTTNYRRRGTLVGRLLALQLVVAAFSTAGCFVIVVDQQNAPATTSRHNGDKSPLHSPAFVGGKALQSRNQSRHWFRHGSPTKLFATGSSSSSSKEQKARLLDQVFNDDLTNQIARDVARHMDLPLIPRPIIAYALSEALRNVKTDLSEDTMEQLLEVLRTEATPSPYDDYTAAELDALSLQMATELSPGIAIPLLQNRPEAQQDMVQKLIRSVLSGLTTSRQDQRLWAFNAATQLLLRTPEDRRALAESIQSNWNTFVPGLPKGLQTQLIQRAVDVSADAIAAILPSDLMQTLRGEHNDNGWDQIKEQVVQKVGDTIDLSMFLTSDQTTFFVRTMVDLLLRQYVEGTDAELLLMAGDLDRQEASLLSQQAMLQREKKYSRRRYEREMTALQAQSRRVRERLRHVRHQRPWYRRLFRLLLRSSVMVQNTLRRLRRQKQIPEVLLGASPGFHHPGKNDNNNIIP
jgi:hypothetical protein